MQKKQARKKRTVVFQSNLDFQRTFDHLSTLPNPDVISSLYINQKGSIILNVTDWDPSLVMISPQGSVTCKYYEGPVDLNKIVTALPDGWAYAHPECTAVNAIAHALYDLFIPIKGEDMSIEIKHASLEAERFHQLRNWRQEKQYLKSEGLRYVCDCGKPYKREVWFERHIEQCDQFDSLRPHICVRFICPGPRTLTVVGFAPNGVKVSGRWADVFGEGARLVVHEEKVTAEELKKAAIRRPSVPVYLGIPVSRRWN